MQRQYNFIYGKIVADEDDFIGHIAYSLYKRDKIQFIENFKKDNGGKEPTDGDLVPFHSITSMDNFVAGYRLKAENILDNFLNTTLTEAVQGIEDQVKAQQKESLESIIAPLKPHPTWKQVLFGTVEHFLATVLFSALLALFVILSFTHSVGVKQTIENVWHVKIVSDTTKTEAAH